MMPMALSWCFLCSVATSLTDLLLTCISFMMANHNQHADLIGFGFTRLSLNSNSLNGASGNESIVGSLNVTSINSAHINESARGASIMNSSHENSILYLAGKLLVQLLTKLAIYLTINLVCLYTKYLIDLAQRNAFLETRRSIETRAKIERENDKQERLLLSLLPRFVALEIIADIAKEDNHDKLLKNQFHKIYIHSYSNVR